METPREQGQTVEVRQRNSVGGSCARCVREYEWSSCSRCDANCARHDGCLQGFTVEQIPQPHPAVTVVGTQLGDRNCATQATSLAIGSCKPVAARGLCARWLGCVRLRGGCAPRRKKKGAHSGAAPGSAFRLLGYAQDRAHVHVGIPGVGYMHLTPLTHLTHLTPLTPPVSWVRTTAPYVPYSTRYPVLT